MTKGLGGMLLAVASFFGLAVIGVAVFFILLPDVNDMRRCPTTEWHHVHLCDKDAGFTTFEKISPYIIGAVIMSEDAAFYSHGGIDVEEMKESAIKDMNEGRFARGGSTITQQLAKNVFLNGNKNILRKIEEVYLSFQIEKYFTKKQILTYYLNVVEFAPDIYGVRGACEHYFKKPPNEVTPEQAAFLAFLLPNPKKYHQSFVHHQLTPFASKMVHTILHKMKLGHKITDVEFEEADARIAHFTWDIKNPGDEFAPNNTDQPGSDQAGTAAAVDAEDSPMGTSPGSRKSNDQTNQNDDDEFKFDFSPDENSK